ncbi:MAG: dTDP-4-dehydrorhamnose reductase [Rhodobacteraceae bacterium]|nr:dTDP-4-dehydrorhamnose reductase [Paracoccaceae bacterium]
MTILVFGATGQVGRVLAQQPGVHALDRGQADLTEPAACAEAILAVRPGMVINAAAYTRVDAAETEEAVAQLVNADAPGAMAQACARMAVPFVHISTDYVFDGSGDEPWRPNAPTAPLNAYGRTKQAGEAAVLSAGGIAAILRTSWVFDLTGQNFVTTMLRLGAERDSVRVVADQVGGPTPAGALARACWRVGLHLQQTQGNGGCYHFSGTPDTSWAGFARAILDSAGLTCAIEDILTAEFPTPAMRPRNSRLDCNDTEAVFGLQRPDWRAALTHGLTRRKEP